MKTKLFKILRTAFLLMAIVLYQKNFANAAQPGIWNAGGTVYTMLYPEDANTFKKIQMQQERIFIQLYKGFAVVKGTYVFKNTTNEHLQFKMGYPINGIYSGGENDLNQIILDSLSQFKIKANNKWLLLEKENHPEINNNTQNINAFSDNWKVWQMQFAPNEIQKVAVYFIVNTNEARIRKGYDIEKRNAFIYLLESGSVWKNNIEKGEFYIQLMDDLTPENVQGISNGFDFKFNAQYKIFAGKKTNFAPTPKDNLIINYSEFNEKFSFENVIKQTHELFVKIDQLSQLSFESLTYSTIELGNPYEVESTIEGTLPGLLTLFVIFAPFIIGFLGIGIAVWVIVKWIRLKRKSTNMIAIAIFYIIIIGFLFLMIQLIQKYFETYTNLHNGELNNTIEIKNQMHCKIQNTIDFQKEINHVIQNRLSEFERKFPSISNENEIPSKFIEHTKKAISTSLQLIKI